MNNFTYSIPTVIHFGKGQISHLSELKKNGDKVLLVYGGGSIKRSGLYDEAMKILTDSGLSVTELSGVEPNPRIESVRKGVELCRENKIDMVLAIGGGSTIDCAKVVAAGACYDGDPWDLVLDGGKIKVALPVYSVLTLSATGSEMDEFAVISDMSKNEKWGTGSPLVKPVMSVLDPTYTFSVSKKQTKTYSFDNTKEKNRKKETNHKVVSFLYFINKYFATRSWNSFRMQKNKKRTIKKSIQCFGSCVFDNRTNNCWISIVNIFLYLFL